MCTEEVRIRWVQSQTKTEWLLAKVKELVLFGFETAEEKLGMVRLALLLPLSCRHTDTP